MVAIFWVGAAFAADQEDTGTVDDAKEASPKPGAAGNTKTSDIEDTSIEGLLGMNLEDRLGQTEAVSRRNESILRAPATITSIDSTQIRLSGATSVPDAIRLVPGVAVYKTAPGNHVVALRGTGGLTGNNIILLIDGIPINSPLDGNVSWDLIPLHVEDIERIEVVRGPVSPSYGADAYTGVINIVTRTSLGLSPSYVGRLQGGTNLDGKARGSASGRLLYIRKKEELRLFLNTEHESGQPPAASNGASQEGIPADRLSATAVFSLLPSKASRLSFELGQAWSRRSSLEHLVLESVPQSQSLLFGRISYEVNNAGPLDNLKLWAHGMSLTISAEQSQRAGFSYDGTRGARGAAGADLAVAFNRWLTGVAGGQGSLERINARYIHPNANGEVRSSYGFYGGLKASLPSFDLLVTSRGDLMPISVQLEYSYRASAIYYTNTWSLRLTGASAFRAPTYVEAVGRFIDPATGFILLEGDPRIGAPRNTSIELGAVFSPETTLTVSPTVYLSRLSNLMVEDFESLVLRTFRNDPNPRTYAGGELEANWRINDAFSVLPSFGVLYWLDTSAHPNTNVGLPDQNSRYTGGLRIQGVFGNDRWGYGFGGSVVSSRRYDLRAGIPPLILSNRTPTSVYLTAMLEHQLVNAPSIWGSLRLNASEPRHTPESPLPGAASLGESAIFGLEIRSE